MTPEKLLEIMGDIDEKYIAEADPTVKNNIIKFNFASLAGIAAGMIAIVAVSNYMITQYKHKNWDTFEVGVSNVAPAEQYSDAAEESEEEYAKAKDNDMSETFDTGAPAENSIVAGAGSSTQSAGSNTRTYAKAADNSMPEAVNENEAAYTGESAAPEETGESSETYIFPQKARFEYLTSTPEPVLNAVKSAVTELKADTSEYFYMSENSKIILSPEYVRKNALKDFSPKELESDKYIYYISQYKNDELIGYLAIDESGKILEYVSHPNAKK